MIGKHGLSVILIGLVVLLLNSCSSLLALPAVRCQSAFEATVQQGPDAGLALVGTLALTIAPSGSLTGTLTLADNTSIDVMGQATGRAINLALHTSEAQYVFGVGTGVNDIRACGGGPWGGPFVGPQPGDSGDWVADKMEAGAEGIRR